MSSFSAKFVLCCSMQIRNMAFFSNQIVDNVACNNFKVFTEYSSIFIVLWHVDPLLGNVSEISKYTTAVAE
jgi:hypothetical protein